MFFKPKKVDIIKEENIVFHGTNYIMDEETNNETDLERQKELDTYRKKFEEALVRIEDQEDVIALENAKREIDDEFEEA